MELPGAHGGSNVSRTPRRTRRCPGRGKVSSLLVATVDVDGVVDGVVDGAHNEGPTNRTVLLSHRRADYQREYCRTVMGLFEETHRQRDW